MSPHRWRNAHTKQMQDSNVLLTGEVTGKVSKKLNNSLKPHGYPSNLMLSNGSDKSVQHMVSFWFMRKSYLDCILAEPDQRKALRDPQSAVATILSLNSLIHCPLYPLTFRAAFFCRFRNRLFFTGQSCWPCAKPSTRRARGSLFVRPLPFHLSSMDGPTRSTRLQPA